MSSKYEGDGLTHPSDYRQDRVKKSGSASTRPLGPNGAVSNEIRRLWGLREGDDPFAHIARDMLRGMSMDQLSEHLEMDTADNKAMKLLSNRSWDNKDSTQVQTDALRLAKSKRANAEAKIRKLLLQVSETRRKIDVETHIIMRARLKRLSYETEADRAYAEKLLAEERAENDRKDAAIAEKRRQSRIKMHKQHMSDKGTSADDLVASRSKSKKRAGMTLHVLDAMKTSGTISNAYFRKAVKNGYEIAKITTDIASGRASK